MSTRTALVAGGLVVMVLVCPSPAPAAVIFSPMIDQFDDPGASEVDEWSMVVDSSGSITVEVFQSSEGAAEIAIDGGAPVAAPAGATTSVTLGGLTPGTVHTFTHTKATGSADVTHYRPKFSGVDQVFITESALSPNDRANIDQPISTSFSSLNGSNIELGFDTRFDTLPSTFADTTWFYDLAVGDTIDWLGFFDSPGGADAVRIELFDALGVSQTFALGPSLLALPGTTFTDTVAVGQEGFWSVTLTAPASFVPFAGHYLMDVTVTDSSGVVDTTKSARHYLLPGSIKNPESIPEPASLALFGAGLLGLGFLRRRRRWSAARA